MIQEIITLLREKTNYKYVFCKADIKDIPCVIYNYNDNSNNGILRPVKLILQIVVSDTKENSIIKSEEMKKNINSVILTFGDRQLTKNILSVEQNGGGMLKNDGENTIHQFLYYDIIYKEKR